MPKTNKLAGLAEVQEILGVSRQRADQLANTKGFPATEDVIGAGRIWKRAKIEAYAANRGKPVLREPVEDAP